MNIDSYDNDLYNTLYKFIMKHLHHKYLYNDDMKITHERITFSIGNEVFGIDVDTPLSTILDKIEYFIVSNNF